MSWVNDLASGVGIPAGAATLAVAMYAACAAAEKAARPEALKDIGRIFKDTSWERSVRPSAIIERVFVWTFGGRHLSLRCAFASAFATIVFCYLLASAVSIATGRTFRVYPLLVFVYYPYLALMSRSYLFLISPVLALCSWSILAFITLVPDYVALLKTRFLIKFLDGKWESTNGILFIISDTALSAIISVVTIFLVYYTAILAIYLKFPWSMLGELGTAQLVSLVFPGADVQRVVEATHLSVIEVCKLGIDTLADPFADRTTPIPPFSITFWSTMLTSIWTTLILLSATIVKLLAPLQRFTAWFFDVERHPLRAVGIVSGALVMIGSLVWTVLRAVI